MAGSKGYAGQPGEAASDSSGRPTRLPLSSHLAIQRTFQSHVDNAVSKTINLPESATPDDILSIYVEAHRMGLKGTTVFRNRSRDYQILSCGTHQIC